MPILKSMKHEFEFQPLFCHPQRGGLNLLLALILLNASPGWADRLPLNRLEPIADRMQAIEQLTARPVADEASPTVASGSAPSDSDEFYQGVKAYREGDYKQAARLFALLHRQNPDNTRNTYYWAISEAQLGHFQQAKKLYEEILTLEPQGKAANLARQGLSYLPNETELDLPPRFQSVEKPAEKAPEPAKTNEQTVTAPTNGVPTEAMIQAMKQNMQGMSPQDWMTMQMLMGQNNPYGGMNNGMSNGMNPMGMMMPGMMGSNGTNGMDPNVMSNMMMNQMMQGFGFGGDSGENR